MKKATLFPLLLALFAHSCGKQDIDPVTMALSGPLGSPLVTEDLIIVGSQDGNLYAIDRTSGKKLWNYKAGDYAGLVVYKNLVYVSPRGKGELHAVNIADGKLAWVFEAGHAVHDYRDKFINGIPSIYGNRLYVSSEDWNVYMLDPRTGKELARLILDEEPQAMEIAISEGVGYIGAWDGYLYAINLDDLTLIWKSETNNDHIGQTTYSRETGLGWISDNPNGKLLNQQAPYVTVVPLVGKTKVYFADWAGNLMAVNKSDGKQVWRHSPSTRNMRHVGPRHYLSEYQNIIYYGTLEDGHIYGVDKTSGERVFETETGTMINGPMFSAGRFAFTLEYTMDADGNVDWSLPIVKLFDMKTREFQPGPDGVGSFPYIVDETTYLGLADGRIVSIDMDSGVEQLVLGPEIKGRP